MKIAKQLTIGTKEKSIHQHEEGICVSCRCFHDERKNGFERERERETRRRRRRVKGMATYDEFSLNLILCGVMCKIKASKS